MEYCNLVQRAQGHFRRAAGRLFFRRRIEIPSRVPYISFTFDDFPRSALLEGGAILSRFDVRATYYASFGLMGTVAPTGRIFEREDIGDLLSRGHELGCHTFSHSNAWETAPGEFEESLARNRAALDEVAPGAVFKTFSYPIEGPSPRNKRKTGALFHCCRSGGQAFNAGTADLGVLKAWFLEKSKGDPTPVMNIIDQNREARGWLIFATHDISDSPTPYGCTPFFFERIVRYSVGSGAKILPISEVLKQIQ